MRRSQRNSRRRLFARLERLESRTLLSTTAPLIAPPAAAVSAGTPPTATFASGGPVAAGSIGSVTFSKPSDSNPADVTAGFTYSADFNNDGVLDWVNTTPTISVPAAYLAAPGTYTIRGRISDVGGAFTDYTTQIQVNPSPSISGAVFIDSNSNGTRDAGETGLANVGVFIDANNNGVLDIAEKSGVTDSSGQFTIWGVADGTYRVRQIIPAQWAQTQPVIGSPRMVTVTGGQSVTSVDFGDASDPASAAGAADARFGSGGTVTTDFGTTNDKAEAVALQPDGKLVVAGYTANAAGTAADFAVARYNTNGSLDTTFGSGGKVKTDLGGIDKAFAVAIQADGKIVVGGVSQQGFTFKLALARYNTNGTLDTSFGSGGELLNGGFGLSAQQISSVLIQSDQTIVAVGSGTGSQSSAIEVYRFSPTGSVVSSAEESFWGFNNNLYYNVTSYGATQQANGDIVIVGSASASGAPECVFITGFTADGGLDSSFTSSGHAAAFMDNVGVGRSIAINRGAYYVGGIAKDNKYAVFFFSPTSQPQEFESNLSTTPSAADQDCGIAVQSDSKVVLGGYDAAQGAMGICRLTLPGLVPDTTYGNQTIADVKFAGSSHSQGAALAIQPDGRVIVAGYSQTSTTDFAIARIDPGMIGGSSIGLDGTLKVAADFFSTPTTIGGLTNYGVVATGSTLPSYPYQSITRIIVQGGNGNDVLSVNGQLPIPVSFDGGAGVDVFNVASGVSGDTITMTPSGITGTQLSATWTNVERIGISADSYGSTINIDGSPANILVGLNGSPSANNTFNLNAVGAGSPVTISGNSGNDTVNISTQSPINASFDGGQGTDSLTIDGTSADEDFVLSSTTISSANIFVSFAHVESVAINAGAGNDTLTAEQQPACTTSFDGGDGNDSLILAGQVTVNPASVMFNSNQPTLNFANVEGITYQTAGGTAGLTNNSSLPVTVGGAPPVNTPPVASAGGPYSVSEGGAITLDASASSATGWPIVSYIWEVNGNALLPQLWGQKVQYTVPGLDGPATLQVSLQITDAAGNTVSAASSITLNDAPPTAKFSSGGSVKLGSAGSVSFSSQTDPSPADVAAGFKYSFDFNNDGTFEITDSSSASAVVPATYLASAGLHTIHGRIKDKDGGFTDYTTTITVTAPTLASISGTVFADNNGNAKLDSGEAGVSGRKLYIDKNKNGVLDAGEPTFTTGANGAFTFGGLAAGTYRVRDLLPSGWRRTSPTAGYFDVTVSAGQTITGKNFAETTRGLISGVVFKDANGNGIKDSTEVGMSGWVVYLDTNNNGKLDAGELSFTTGSDGKFSFVVPAGTYHLREVLKSGFKRTAPSTGVYTIALASGKTATGKNFGDK